MLPTHHGSRWAVLSRGARQTLFTLWKVIQQSSVLQPAVFSLTGYWFSVPSILIKSLNWECAEINNPELTISWQMDLWIIPWSLVRRLSGVFLWVFTKGLNTYTSQNVHVLQRERSFLLLRLTTGPGIPRRPSGPGFPAGPWGPTGPVLPGGPSVPDSPYMSI